MKMLASQLGGIHLNYSFTGTSMVSSREWRSQGKGRAMRVRGKVSNRCSKLGIAILALLFVGVICDGVAVAQTKRTGGPSPSPARAEVYFIDLKDGATVPAN